MGYFLCFCFDPLLASHDKLSMCVTEATAKPRKARFITSTMVLSGPASIIYHTTWPCIGDEAASRGKPIKLHVTIIKCHMLSIPAYIPSELGNVFMYGYKCHISPSHRVRLRQCEMSSIHSVCSTPPGSLLRRMQWPMTNSLMLHFDQNWSDKIYVYTMAKCSQDNKSCGQVLN